MGSGENRKKDLRQNNRTRVQWRQNSCAKHVVSQARLSLPPCERLACETTECGEDGKWALCMHTMCPHSTHTLVWVGWIAEASEAPTLGSWVAHPLSVLPVCHCLISETKHQTPCTKQDVHETKRGINYTLVHNYTIEQHGVCLHWWLLVIK